MIGEWSSTMMLGMCFKCSWNFPRYLISVAAITKEGGEMVTVHLCPICMLEILNRLKGMPEGTPYSDPAAIHQYETAQKFLSDRLN